MLYCPGCKRLFEGEKCPACGKKHGRAPEGEDFCLVYSGGQIWADMASDVLEQNGIICMVQSSRGAAMAMLTGLLSDQYELYVPYASFDQAKEILDALFASVQTEEEDTEETETEETDFEESGD